MKLFNCLLIGLFLVCIACAEKKTPMVEPAEDDTDAVSDYQIPADLLNEARQGVSKITGVSYEMPVNPVDQKVLGTVKRVNAKWVAMIPYGWTDKGDAKVNFVEGDENWWGENVVGTTKCIQMAKSEGLKVMLKPHVWVVGQGWPGDFDLVKEEDWRSWEDSYRAYILRFAEVAKEQQVDLFCIGTEYRKAVVKRPKFWKQLVTEVKRIYDGPLTYAANWDNYEKVTFWNQLDYIGIDAYFPLSEKAQPTVSELREAWGAVEDKLAKFSAENDRSILFTEYGYKSIEYSNAGFWKYQEDTVKTSAGNQNRAYQALYESVWMNDWMAGGFLWKWHLYPEEKIGGESNRRYTPQGKPTEETIIQWYGLN